MELNPNTMPTFSQRAVVKEFVGHVFNVPISKDFEHVENVLHKNFTDAERRTTLFRGHQHGGDLDQLEAKLARAANVRRAADAVRRRGRGILELEVRPSCRPADFDGCQLDNWLSRPRCSAGDSVGLCRLDARRVPDWLDGIAPPLGGHLLRSHHADRFDVASARPRPDAEVLRPIRLDLLDCSTDRADRIAALLPTILRQFMADKSQPPTNTPSDFERQSEEAPPGLIAEFLDFLKTSKKWWLTPIIVVLLLIGVLIILSGTAAAPFIYTLF